MFWLGLLLAVCYVPGYTGASVPTQWVVLSAFLPACLWYRSPLTMGHKLFLLWIAYALFTLTWVLNIYSAVWALWLLFVWALSYHLGTIVTDLRSLWKGLALGLTVSTVVAIAQGLDLSPVETNMGAPSGLFFNSALLGIISGLVLVALATERLWWYMPPLAVNLILSGSRGGLVILALGLCALHSRLLALAALIVGSFAFIMVLDPADSQRLQIWGVTINVLTLWGQGIGSFADLYYAYAAREMLIRPEYVHNDPLQLIYEFGLAAIIPLGLFALALTVAGRNFPILFAWCAAALFFFPLYTPLTAFIGCVLAGYSIASWDVVRHFIRSGRSTLLSWLDAQEAGINQDGIDAVPMVVRTAKSEVA